MPYENALLFENIILLRQDVLILAFPMSAFCKVRDIHFDRLLIDIAKRNLADVLVSNFLLAFSQNNCKQLLLSVKNQAILKT